MFTDAYQYKPVHHHRNAYKQVERKRCHGINQFPHFIFSAIHTESHLSHFSEMVKGTDQRLRLAGFQS